MGKALDRIWDWSYLSRMGKRLFLVEKRESSAEQWELWMRKGSDGQVAC